MPRPAADPSPRRAPPPPPVGTPFVLLASGEPVELLHVAEREGGPGPEAWVELPDGRRLAVPLAALGAAAPRGVAAA